MSLFKRKQFLLSVSQTDLRLSELCGRTNGRVQLLQSIELESGAYLHALRAGLAALRPTDLPRHARITITLSAPLARVFLVTPPSNATTLDDLKGAASLRFSTLYGLPSEDWRIAAAWSARHVFLACAVGRALLDVLIAFVTARKLSLLRIASAPLEAWRQVDGPPASSENWLVSRQSRATTLILCNKRQVHAIRSVQWPDETWQSLDAVREAIQVEAMRLDRAAPKVAYGVGDIPSEFEAGSSPDLMFKSFNQAPRSRFRQKNVRVFDIDLSPGPVVRAKLTSGLFAVCVSVLVGVGMVTIGSVQLATQMAEVKDRTVGVHARLAARQRPVATESSSSIKADQAVSVNKAIGQLNLPWRQLLQDVEASTPQEIALLSIEPDAKRNVLKGTAEAPDAAGMLAYMTRLKTRGHFASVLLARHEVNEQDPMHPLRFQFEANWNEAKR